ncbi:MAG: class I SAM-dependent methyltransferase [Oscillospiraceae bacterium]|jgi:predicted O-methyltransferase YrrM|nr:class I SAM-dependent methyltransferase [Oscillospiraceae bacterium]
MKKENLSLISVIPEEHDVKHFDNIDFSRIRSEMNADERLFVNGLIRYYQPESVLEIGVSGGGGTVILLNAINDLPESKLVSIDCMERCYYDDIPIGSNVEVYYKSLPEGKWTLFTGKDPSEVLMPLGRMFDFAVIDTAHFHPIESLNFLCALPYLKDGAIVILHDISLFTRLNKENGFFDLVSAQATRILISTLVGNKLFPKTKSMPYISDSEFVNNIGAIQITSDTRKYISNVFHALALPWESYPAAHHVESIRHVLEAHYDKPLLEMFDEAVRWYSVWLNSGKRTFSLKQINKAVRGKLSENMVFYGAGKNMRAILHLFDACGITFDYRIWDADADKIKTVGAHKVFTPDFDTYVSGITAVVTIENNMIAEYVEAQLQNSGYNVIKGMAAFIDWYPRGLIKFAAPAMPVEFSYFEKNLIYRIVSDGLSMVSKEGLFATLSACKYAIQNNIDGDFVECGVWRGGNAIIAASVFKEYGSSKKVWLFDTFEGFVEVKLSKNDRGSLGQVHTMDRMDAFHERFYNPSHCGNSISEVRNTFKRYGLLDDNVIFVKGDVMETLEDENIPDKVAVLRLDTDWYDSTRKELEVFYPRLSNGGVLIIDDYGFCHGCRTAVEQYFESVPKPLMHYINYTIRVGVKIC